MLRCTDDRIAEEQTCLNVFILDCCRTFKYTASESAEGRKRFLDKDKEPQAIFANACGPNSEAVDGKGFHGGPTIPSNKMLYV